MSTEFISTLTSRGTVLTTELDSLADAAYSGVGSELENATNKDRFGIAEVGVTFGSAPTDYSVLDLYMVTALDGTNYPDGSASLRPSQEKWVGSFQLRAVTTAQRVQCAPFEMLGCKSKFILRNGSGQALPASGTTVNLYTFNREIG